MTISGGENLYPAEVEAVIQTHPTVRKVAVIGQDDDKWGETVHAVIVASRADLSEQAILEHCQGELSRYKRERFISWGHIATWNRWLSPAKPGYQRANAAPRRPSTSSARTCKRACAPIGDQRICCDFDIRLSISWLTADSMNAVEILRPLR
ncbi:MAG: hypothetical protein GQ538_11265 [Xanthomonadales bacterium]|nr:hypothetical protein [Xanthomonadales bacterium]